MLFLLNNPVIMIVGLFILVLMTFSAIKMGREIKWNRLLTSKHRAMRLPASTNPGFKTRMGLLASTALAPLVVVALVLTTMQTTTVTPTGELHDIRSANDVLDIMETFEARMQSYNLFRGWMEDDIALENFAPTNDALDGAEGDYTDGGDEGSDDYSETNNQVTGVDEMDNVVTDGKYIYVMQNNKVFISLAYTQAGEASVLSNYKTIEYVDEETECPSGMYVTGLYVDDDYLVVVGSEYEYYCDKEGEEDFFYYDYWYGYNDNVSVYVYDKADDFALLNEYNVSGNLIGTRKIGDNLAIITTTYLPYTNDEFEVDSYLPEYAVDEELTTATYRDISYVDGTEPNSFTSFYMIDLDNEAIDMEVVLGDNGYNLYVSENNIYLAGNIYYFVPMADIIDVEDPVSETKTAITKVEINDADLTVTNTGTVPGYTLNQFSMDEYNGYLRVATTTGWWGDNINNRVFILDENLDEVSRLENLGEPGETIKSVRFTGVYGYVVTFEQTDPFYVLDLADEDNPSVVGELKVPGFSSYLQPLGNDYILGIGFGDSDGGTNGLKISIYDITDKTNPVVFSEAIFDYSDFGWGWSSATYEHKDLLVDLNKGIIALPFSTYNYNEVTGSTYNSGILVYNFDETDGLTYDGFIRHEQDAEEDVYVYKIKFISDYFYTVSRKYIKASLISEPETILHSVTLPE
ncbi:beta-propeller domain-containing protein [Candidatus Xianfuyuplasma coldseepsis]|uniref:Beta propeller domain protein n=1 Tax=Candidatus Xianfuyuplasma coldseepsis TaxID=2782163 RepID=A0A7L7KRH5_9MOLU|nr:beta-propeller domain-containing protein [Xianfuyuplasma coldseepsis]QMS85009.1 hypothetical protein G4Z02_04320 [Xianfuyuplasma coldseepsis]